MKELKRKKVIDELIEALVKKDNLYPNLHKERIRYGAVGLVHLSELDLIELYEELYGERIIIKN